MEEQTSWKGHTFTLLVFGGIVFLCSIFFVLGMLVGRGQGQRSAESAAVLATAKTVAANAAYEGVETGKPAASAPDPVKAGPPITDRPIIVAETKAEANAEAAPPPAPVKMIYLQVDALEKETAANKELDELRMKGFTAVIMKGEGANRLFRVQVGPFSNTADAETVRRKLEALGYKPITK